MNQKSPSESLIWRMAGGDASRQGLLAQPVAIASHPSRVLPALGSVQASVVFDSGRRAFVSDMAGFAQAFDLDGSPLWRANLPGPVSATPAVHPNQAQLYVGTHIGWICALHTETGALLWQKQLPTQSDPRILSDLLLVPQQDVVIASSWGGRFLALDAQTGHERFSWDAGLTPYSAAAADSQGSIYCLRAVSKQGVQFVRVSAEGKEFVLHRTPEQKRGARRTLVAAAPVIDSERGLAYFVTNLDEGSTLHAWSLSKSSILWEHPLPHSVQATPTVRHDGVILIPDLAGDVHGVSPDGGSRFEYSCACDYLLAGAVTELGGASFIGDPLGRLHQIDPGGAGKVLFETPRSIQSRPSFDVSRSLYLASTDGKVYVFSGFGPDGSSAAR